MRVDADMPRRRAPTRIGAQITDEGGPAFGGEDAALGRH